MLAAQAQRLNRQAGTPAAPGLYFLTDPARTPDPLAVVRRLPRATAVIYRHFGASGRSRMARALASLCRSRGLVLLVAADPELALAAGAAGVHWPELLAPPRRDPGLLLTTISAHSAAGAARAAAFGADACILAPVLATRSGSGNAPLGLFRASQIARAAQLPVIALGGINAGNAHRLAGRGFAGLAAIDGLMED